MDTEKKSGRRLNKAVAAAGFCSRRKADALIFAGCVRVNGELEQNPGRTVFPEDAVRVDGHAPRGPKKFVYVLLNKPAGVVSTVRDPQGRRTVVDCLPEHLRTCGLYPVGRLDYFSEGLLMLTNDGDLTYRLTHPSWHQKKKYEIVVRGPVDADVLRAMRTGMTLSEGDKLLPVAVKAATDKTGNTILALTLRQGINRQIRRMCRDLNLTILRLKRVSQGILTLGDLPPGHARILSPGEIDRLMDSFRNDIPRSDSHIRARDQKPETCMRPVRHRG
ncbi:MAG: rRNA pseudouridine synthase [Desulfovibrio sp.]|jgi:23S rRNA pseudouridine2605 synthase|nr:rRNA pseudouridine synthase [Desulfovibrio sp.]